MVGSNFSPGEIEVTEGWIVVLLGYSHQRQANGSEAVPEPRDCSANPTAHLRLKPLINRLQKERENRIQDARFY